MPLSRNQKLQYIQVVLESDDIRTFEGLTMSFDTGEKVLARFLQ